MARGADHGSVGTQSKCEQESREVLVIRRRWSRFEDDPRELPSRSQAGAVGKASHRAAELI